MASEGDHDCHFLCFRNCVDSAETSPPPRPIHQVPSFEKLSLKRIKEDQTHAIQRARSFKRMERVVPTTERSAEEGAEYISFLVEERRRLEMELGGVNQHLDRCYEIYRLKLIELKRLEAKLQEKSKRKLKI